MSETEITIKWKIENRPQAEPSSNNEPVSDEDTLPINPSNSKGQFSDGYGSEELFEYMEAEAAQRRIEMLYKIPELPRTRIELEISEDNPINTIFSYESQLSGIKVTPAYREIGRIIRTARTTIPADLGPVESLTALYKIIRRDIKGSYVDFGVLSEQLSAKDKAVDCDTGCFIFLAVGHELNWPLYMASTKDHAMIFWALPNNTYIGFETTNGLPVSYDYKEIIYRNAPLIVSRWDNVLLAHVFNNLANEYHRAGRHDIAAHMFTRSLLLGVADPYLFTQALLSRANEYHELNKNYLAVKDYTAVYNMDKTDVAPLVGRGLAFAHLGRHDLAIRGYDRAIEIDPNFPQAWNNRGLEYFNSGDFPNARDCFLRAIQLDASAYVQYFNLGNAYSMLADFEAAINAYSMALVRNPTYAPAIKNIAIAYQMRDMSASKSAGELFKKVQGPMPKGFSCTVL